MNTTNYYRNNTLVLLLLFLFTHSTSSLHQIIFLIDDLGFHDLGYTGSGVETPTLDQLHSEGIELSNYYVWTICTPSRASLLTGRYPFALGLQGSRTIQPLETWGLPLNETTIAQFIDSSYESHQIGKWHLGGSSWKQIPTFRGFSSSYGYLLGAEDYYTHEVLGYDMLRSSSKNCGPSCSTSDRSVNGTYSAFIFASEAERVIAEYATRRAANLTNGKDLFLYLAWQSVHAPVQAPSRFVEPYKHIFQDEIRQIHAGMLAALDEGIKNVTRALDFYGLLNQSVILTSTDNGGPSGTTCGDCNGALNFPLRGGKHSLFEGGVRGTGFIWSKALFGTSPLQRKYKGLAHISDWLPTLTSFSNITPIPLPGFELHGFDLSSNLISTAKGIGNISSSPREYAIIAINPTCNGTAGIVTSDGWKLLIGDPGPPYSWDNSTEISVSDSDFISIPTGPPGPMATCADGSPTPPVVRLWPLLNQTIAGLFFLPTDPREETDLSSQYPQVVQRLLDLLEPWGSSKQIWPSQNATQDKRGDPKLHGGNLIPWLD